jgi:hypothetical protein
MIAGDLYDLFRSDVVDVELPYLWSDTEIFAYMDDAYKMFVRLLGGIADNTSDITQVPIVTGEATAALDYRILKHRGVRLQSTNRPIDLINLQDGPVAPASDYGAIWAAGTDDQPGPVRFMVIGEQDDVARWVQVPVEDDVALLTIYRLPLVDITDAGSTFDDVRPHHHFHLLKWMRHLAYGKQDAETFNRAKSKENEDAFKAYCEQARREWERQKSKTRVVAYGGIGMP